MVSKIVHCKISFPKLNSFFTVLFVLLFTSIGYSQGSSILVGGGYGISVIDKNDNVYFTAGTGVSGMGGYRYMFSKRIGAQLEMRYESGKGSISNKLYDPNIDATYSDDRLQWSKAIYVTPSVVSFIFPDRIWYARLGFYLNSVKTNTELTSTVTTSNGNVVSKNFIEGSTNGKLSLGAIGGLGAEIPLKGKLSGFLEARFNMTNFVPKEGTISNSVTSNREVVFVENPKVVTDPSQPLQVKQTTSPINSVSLHLGLIYKLK